MVVFHAFLVAIFLLFQIEIGAYNPFPLALKRTHHSSTSIQSCGKDDADVKTLSMSSVGASIICAALFIAPPIVHAKGKTSGASVAFLKSEEAIDNAQTEYKQFDKYWDNTKKSIEVSFRRISKSIETFRTIQTDISQIVAKLESLTASGDAYIATVSAEVDGLVISTGEKYQAAEKSSENLARPATTAALFTKAQNEAAILEKDKTVLKTLTDGNKVNVQVLNKAKDVLAVIDSVIAEAESASSQQGSGLIEILAGISSNENVCKETVYRCTEDGKAGIEQFKGGVTSINSAQDRFYKVLQQLEADIKSVGLLKVDLDKGLDRLSALEADLKEWQEETKLSLKEGKKKSAVYTKEVKSIASSLDKYYDVFKTRYNDIVGKTAQEQRSNKELSQLVKSKVRTSLEMLQKSSGMSSNAEKLFIQARTQGEKETAKYLKTMPTPLPIPAPTASPTSGSTK